MQPILILFHGFRLVQRLLQQLWQLQMFNYQFNQQQAVQRLFTVTQQPAIFLSHLIRLLRARRTSLRFRIEFKQQQTSLVNIEINNNAIVSEENKSLTMFNYY